LKNLLTYNKYYINKDLDMFVEDFGSNLSSADLNGELQKVYNWSINLNEMNNDAASGVLKNMRMKIESIKNSSKSHYAEKNPKFMEALLVTKVLETFIEENYHNEMMGRKLKKAEMGRREKYVKGIKKVAGDFEKRYPGRSEEVMYATATKMAKNESVEEAMDILRNVLNGNSQVISESEYENAKAIMAARDMVDTIQDMVETLSAMTNEDLPALADVMRNEIGQQQADSFVAAVNSAVGPLLDTAKNSRAAIDAAARAAAGESIMNPVASADPVPADTGLSDIPMPPDEVDATADAAVGGNLELGRTKRS
jgi:hypothetical protein